MKEKYFLISTSEGGGSDIRAFESYKSAYHAMKQEYLEYEFNTSEYGYGVCWITDNEAYVDSPDDGWQRHWLITSFEELDAIDTEEPIEIEEDEEDNDIPDGEAIISSNVSFSLRC